MNLTLEKKLTKLFGESGRFQGRDWRWPICFPNICTEGSRLPHLPRLLRSQAFGSFLGSPGQIREKAAETERNRRRRTSAKPASLNAGQVARDKLRSIVAGGVAGACGDLGGMGTALTNAARLKELSVTQRGDGLPF